MDGPAGPGRPLLADPPAIPGIGVVRAGRRLRIIRTRSSNDPAGFGRAVAAGLTDSPKHLPCRYFYDERGSRVFEEICELPEYYLTRAESEILRAHAGEIASAFDGPITLAELGSGSAAKTRLLIEAFLALHGALLYVPVDISPAMLESSSRALLEDYPQLEIVALAGEYEEGLSRLSRKPGGRPRLILWLGSNVGNLHRPEARAFLSVLRGALGASDRVLLGIDLRKDRATLERAYDDAQGVTARFNLNLLARVNRELGGGFDPGAFRHEAVFNDPDGRIEMYLTSRRDQTVRVEGLGREVFFSRGERLHTEHSYKYSLAEIEELVAGAGLRLQEQWFDAGRRFSVSLLAPGR